MLREDGFTNVLKFLKQHANPISFVWWDNTVFIMKREVRPLCFPRRNEIDWWIGLIGFVKFRSHNHHSPFRMRFSSRWSQGGLQEIKPIGELLMLILWVCWEIITNNIHNHLILFVNVKTWKKEVLKQKRQEYIKPHRRVTVGEWQCIRVVLQNPKQRFHLFQFSLLTHPLQLFGQVLHSSLVMWDCLHPSTIY